MDKLEKYKAENSTNETITDDVVAKAYVEEFALDTFKRADEAQRANKVTKQTADTFIAASTFLDLLHIWGELDKETMTKSKFAKFHAARILKAFKAGEDPNATNPVVEEPPAPAEDEFDAELKAMADAQSGPPGVVHRPPTVESAPDSAMPSRPESTLQGGIAAPPPLSTQTPNETQNYDHEVSPIEPTDNNTARQNSIGGGYFPNIPSAPTDTDMADVGQTPIEPSAPSLDPQDFYKGAAQTPLKAPSAPSPASLGIAASARPSAPTPNQMAAQPPIIPPLTSPPVEAPPAPQLPAQPFPTPAPAPAPIPPVLPAAVPTYHPPPVAGYKTDDEATMLAQKHARWAISALNFEDVNTAVKELRLALQSLGAT